MRLFSQRLGPGPIILEPTALWVRLLSQRLGSAPTLLVGVWKGIRPLKTAPNFSLVVLLGFAFMDWFLPRPDGFLAALCADGLSSASLTLPFGVWRGMMRRFGFRPMDTSTPDLCRLRGAGRLWIRTTRLCRSKHCSDWLGERVVTFAIAW